MGCLSSTESVEEPPKQPVFSWDRDDRPDPKDYTISEQDGTVCGRKPGTINGQQFIIENCKNSSIYIYDHSAMVTIDRCENCTIFIAPIKGSVFIRNCKNLKCAIACQQFRSRDCQKIETFLYCQTQPIIESSTGMKFACFQYYYPELEEQFKLAGLSVYNNTWSTIHDFTPVEQSENWSLIPQSVTLEQHVPRPTSEEFADINVKFESELSVVPFTQQKRAVKSDQNCLIVFFDNNKSKCKEFLKELAKITDYCIIQTKEIKMEPEDVERIFKKERFRELSTQGSVVGLELSGESVIMKCEEVLKEMNVSLNDIFLSNNDASAKNDVAAFYNYIDMMMST
ncbi:protein XRP2-like [Clytia hemisphaerica]|uniref:protein XRP2-like n=1 Tax=Clytia hemisphaerica TaxID=252671 RepID=UPI0034D7162B